MGHSPPTGPMVPLRGTKALPHPSLSVGLVSVGNAARFVLLTQLVTRKAYRIGSACPPFESSLKKRFRVPFVSVCSALTLQTAAQIVAPLGIQERSRHADAPGGSAPASLRGAPPAKPGTRARLHRGSPSVVGTPSQRGKTTQQGRGGQAEQQLKGTAKGTGERERKEARPSKKREETKQSHNFIIYLYFFLNSFIPLLFPLFSLMVFSCCRG